MAFLHTLLGTVFVASGAATLNQLIELRYDAQMRRTARRPLVSGRIAPSHALWFGVLLSVLGVVYLAVSTNAFASLLAALTLLSYLFLYTPLKRITPLCTLVGAFPGAAPPLIGWAAACGHLDAAGLGALRDRLSLAIPAFHVHRVDVSRRLRARRLPRLARERGQRPLCCLAVPAAHPGAFS